MIEWHDGNIFNSKAKYLAHQVNCQGVMGAGIAKQIKDLYPEVYKIYHNLCLTRDYTRLLGTFLDVEVHDRHIVNLFSQDDYNRDYISRCMTNYGALSKCLTDLSMIAYGESVAIPYKIGCGLAGGDWNIVYDIIKKIYGTNDKVTLEIWKLEA